MTLDKVLLLRFPILKSKTPDPILPETVDTISSSPKKSAMIPAATAQFKAIASLGILLLSKLCIYVGSETRVIGELSGSNL